MLTRRTSAISCIVVLATVFFFRSFATAQKADRPTWAKKAHALCDARFHRCKDIRIPAPNGLIVANVIYRGHVGTLRIDEEGRPARTLPLPYGWGGELQWSPDSEKFFVNGDRGGAYWGFFTFVYDLRQKHVSAIDVTSAAQRDMVRLFPPCRDESLDRAQCKSMEKEPDYNMSAIDWMPDSSAIVVVAEIPCSGSYGSGIMCQVMGYEVSVPEGKIVRRIDPPVLKRKWQKSMAWKFRIPDPPDYSWPPK